MKPTVCSRIQDKRARYDRFGKEGLGNMGGFHDYTADFGDIFEELFGQILAFQQDGARVIHRAVDATCRCRSH